MPERDQQQQTVGRASWTSRVLAIFGDVEPGEVRDVVLMFLNIFMLLVAYYVLKTVREPLILAAASKSISRRSSPSVA